MSTTETPSEQPAGGAAAPRDVCPLHGGPRLPRCPAMAVPDATRCPA